jgi:hypothetical protein
LLFATTFGCYVEAKATLGIARRYLRSLGAIRAGEGSMAQSAMLVAALKQQLKAQSKTYADVAKFF